MRPLTSPPRAALESLPTPAVGGGARLGRLPKIEPTINIGLLAAMFYLVVEYVRPQEKYPIFEGLYLGTVSLLLLVLGVLSATRGIRMGGAVGGWIVVLLVWGFFSTLAAGAPLGARNHYFDVIKVIGVFFMLVTILNTPRRVLFFVYFLMLVYFQHTNYSIREWGMGGFIGLPKGQYVGAGFLRNPNDFGAALSAAWGMSLMLGFYDPEKIRGKWKMTWLHRVNTACFLIGLITCSSRGSAVGFVGGALFMWWAYTKGIKAKSLWLMVGLVVGAIVVLMMSDDQIARFNTAGSAEDASSQDRFRTWAVAWQVFKDHPLFGIGIGHFAWVAPAYAPDEVIYVQHNITLQAMTDMGFPGLVIMIGMLTAAAMSIRAALAPLRREGRRPTVMEGLLIGCNVCLVSYLVNAQFITVLFYPFTWVLLAIIVAASRVVEEANAPPPLGRRRAAAAAGAALGTAAVPTKAA